ncbi:hypothetical protein RS030_373725, partial [Cryptosporidium xiaoi]
NRPGLRSTSEAWQGKVLRNRVVPPVHPQKRNSPVVANGAAPGTPAKGPRKIANHQVDSNVKNSRQPELEINSNSTDVHCPSARFADSVRGTTGSGANSPLGVPPVSDTTMEGSVPMRDPHPQELAKAIVGHEQTPDMSWTHPQAEAQARLLLKAFQQGA